MTPSPPAVAAKRSSRVSSSLTISDVSFSATEVAARTSPLRRKQDRAPDVAGVVSIRSLTAAELDEGSTMGRSINDPAAHQHLSAAIQPLEPRDLRVGREL